jgi:uncharacterized membrane protein
MSSIGFGHESTVKYRTRKMGNLFVIGFDEPNQAEGIHFKLQKLQSEGVVDLTDVAVAVKDETGKASWHHAGNLLAKGAAFPSLCGSLANLIFLNATVGAASGALADVGITDRFMKELATVLIPSKSALFVLTRRPTSEGPGTGRTEGPGRQNLYDFAFARGRSQTPSRL